MAARLGSLMLLLLLATATGAAAATSRGSVLVVPEVRHQAYVFAKGMLEEGGFAWRVEGPVQGYAASTVVAQEPAPGTRVYDTGAPTIVLRLARGRYDQLGSPQDVSPFPGTALRPVELAVAATPPRAPKPKPAAKPAKPPVVKKAPRPPAFRAPGAPKEPLDEMPLPARARLLGAWLEKHPRPTSANVRHWLYQHAWIVTGARFGWWRGAEAIELLIGVDQRAQKLWGIGAKSEAVARQALAEVRARAK